MNARPILMHTRSIHNLLAGRKVQTRRIMNPQPVWNEAADAYHAGGGFRGTAGWRWCAGTKKRPADFSWAASEPHAIDTNLCPYGIAGDLLWVREAHAVETVKGKRSVAYRADGELPFGWTPSIHMPRWSSRLTLRITDVRVERVQATSREDIVAEGVQVPVHDGIPVIELTGKSPPAKFLTKDQLGDVGALLRAHWASLWDNTNGVGAWERNDWVWALTFEVLRANVDAVLKRVAA